MTYPYTIQPRPEQLKALREIYRAKHVLVVGDMGVGKTKIGVDFIGNMVWHKKLSRALVIVPIEAIDVWINEIQTNCPFLTYSLFLKGEKVNWNSNIILINYDYICPRRKKKPNSDKYFINKTIINCTLNWNPQVVICDESHRIKKPTARRSKAIHRLGSAEYTICLTGTPTGNRKIIDLWSQFKFIKPDLLDRTFTEHKHRYGIWGGSNGFILFKTKNEKVLAKKIAPYTIRIKKTGLPEKNFIRYPVRFPEEAKTIYKQMEEEFVAYVSGQFVVASIALTKLIKLSQISGGFIKNEKKEDIPIHRAKLNALQEILEDLTESGVTRVVIFARYIRSFSVGIIANSSGTCSTKLA